MPRGTNQLVDNLDHVYRQADRARLISNGSANCLSNPPRGISGKLVAATIVELVHCLHEADLSLLDQIEELQPAVAIILCDGHHEAKVGFDELVFCLLGLHLALDDFALRALELRKRRASIVFQSSHVGAMLPPCSAVFFLEFLIADARNLLFQVTDLSI